MRLAEFRTYGKRDLFLPPNKIGVVQNDVGDTLIFAVDNPARFEWTVTDTVKEAVDEINAALNWEPSDYAGPANSGDGTYADREAGER